MTAWLRPAPTGRPFHQLAHTDVHRWWRPPLGLVTVMVLGIVVTLAFMLGTFVMAFAATGHWLRLGTGQQVFVSDHANLIVLLGSLGALLPVIWFVTIVIDRRPIGTLSSVEGHLRWHWLAWCFLPALGYMAAAYATAYVLEMFVPSTETPGSWVGWDDFWPALLIVVLLVPFQAAAEEYVFRGWLLQAIGSYTRIASAWPAILVSSVPFVLGHGYTDWGPVSIGMFAIAAAWVTVRTGGLEAAIALHIVNNAVGIGWSASEGDISMDQGAVPWTEIVTSGVPLVLWLLVIVWMARHTGKRRPMKRLS